MHDIHRIDGQQRGSASQQHREHIERSSVKRRIRNATREMPPLRETALLVSFSYTCCSTCVSSQSFLTLALPSMRWYSAGSSRFSHRPSFDRVAKGLGS
jgi:hypothetical protein